MKQRILTALGAVGCAVLLALPAVAAAKKPATAAHKTTTKTAATKATARRAWPAETLSGTILMVDPAKDLAVVRGTDGVPFDMIVTRATHIKSGDQHLKLSNLASDMNKNVSVRFVPEGRGDVARSIQITG